MRNIKGITPRQEELLRLRGQYQEFMDTLSHYAGDSAMTQDMAELQEIMYLLADRIERMSNNG